MIGEDELFRIGKKLHDDNTGRTTMVPVNATASQK
jgi:hypothetical protein